MSSRSGSTNTNARGSSYDRRARRQWLLSPKAGFGGDGEKVPCWECGAMVNERTLYVDRIVSRENGGTYRRSNIRPHCCTCSCREGQRRTAELARLRSPYDDNDLCKVCGCYFLAPHAAECPTGLAEKW